MALLHEGDRDKVRVAKPLSDFRNLRSGHLRSREFAFRGVLEEGRDQEIAALDALAILTLKQALPASEPSASWRGLAEKEEVVADPPRASGRARRVACLAKYMIGLLEGCAVLVVEAEHVRRVRQQLEICWFERLLPVRAKERFERVRPGPVRVRPTALFKRSVYYHRLILDHVGRSGG